MLYGIWFGICFSVGRLLGVSDRVRINMFDSWLIWFSGELRYRQ